MAEAGKVTPRSYVESRDGGFWITGSRVSLDSIVLAFLDGRSPESIVTECFPVLSLEQVYGAITFYLARRSEIDASLRTADTEFQAFREATHQANPELADKLKKARREMLLNRP